MFNEELEWKISEHDVIKKVMKESVKLPEREKSSLKDKMNLSQKNSEGVMGCYNEVRTAVSRRIEELCKIAPSPFVGMMLCIIKPFRNDARKISQN